MWPRTAPVCYQTDKFHGYSQEFPSQNIPGWGCRIWLFQILQANLIPGAMDLVWRQADLGLNPSSATLDKVKILMQSFLIYKMGITEIPNS